MASLQAGQRARFRSASVTMASTTFIKDTAGCTGILHLLLLGLLLPSVLVLGEESTAATTSNSTNTTQALSNMTSGATEYPTSTQPPTTSESTGTSTIIQPSIFTTSGPAATSTTILSPSTTSGNTETPVTESATSTTSGGTAITTITQSLTTTATSGASATQSPTTIPTAEGPATSTPTQSPTTTSGGIAFTTTTQYPITTSGGSAIPTQSVTSTATTTDFASSTSIPTYNSISTKNVGTTSAPSTAMTQSSSDMTTSGSMTSMMSASLSSNSTDMPDKNETIMIWCRSFTCNYSGCYTMYTSQNATLCAAGACYCQLIRQTDMWYAVSCSASCADSCVNASQTNCSVKCCNSTGCLNSTFESMMITTTVISTTTTATTPTSQQTTTNGNKCHKGTCTGTQCYTGFVNRTAQMCSSSQPHCQLKKETVDAKLQWTASCTTNCSGQDPCKTSTQPSCHLECCNATTTSCLWLNGTLHVPNFSTRGPHYHTELIASLLCLLAITLLM